MEKNLIEEIEKFNMMVNYDPSKVLSEQGKRLDLTGKIERSKVPRFFGKHSGGIEGGITVTSVRESDVELNSSSDVLKKMNDELLNDEDFKKVPYEIRQNLAEGFFQAILEGTKSEYLKDLSRMQKKDMRKFFRKSQRWAFQIDDASKINGIEDKIKILVPVKTENFEKIKTDCIESVNETNRLNSEKETILSNKCNVLKEKKEIVNETQIINSERVLIGKPSLSTVFVYEDKPFKQYKVREEYIVKSLTPVSFSLDRLGTNFEPGKDDPSAFVNNIVQTIYNNIMKAEFTYEFNGQKKTKTGKDIIDESNSGLLSYIDIDAINFISSASNTWTGKDILDFTHENDGTKVKDIDDLDVKSKGQENCQKNIDLSKRRNKNLGSAVISELQKLPGIKITYPEVSSEVRVTNTKGLLDDEAIKKGLKRGQYASFDLTLIGYTYDAITKPEIVNAASVFGQKIIMLIWKGKEKGKLDIDFGLVFTPGYLPHHVYRPIIDMSAVVAGLKGDLKPCKGCLKIRKSKQTKRRHERDPL